MVCDCRSTVIAGRMLQMQSWAGWLTVWTVLVIGGPIWPGCNSSKTSVPKDAPTKPQVPTSAPPSAPKPGGAHEVHLDLMRVAHLADIEEAGLEIDLGLPSDAKYINGAWRSGWSAPAVDRDERYRRFGSAARLYFHLDEARSLTLGLRIRSEGASRLLPFLNGKALPEVVLNTEAKFADYEIEAPAETVVSGENYLLLRSTETRSVGEEPVSMSVASVRITPAGTIEAATAEPPLLREESGLDGDKRRALRLVGPMRLRWYVDVPTSAELCLSVATVQPSKPTPPSKRAQPSEEKATLRAAVTATGGSPIELGIVEATTEWTAYRWPLEAAAGKIARIELTVAEGTTLSIADARVEVPAEPPVAGVSPARNVIVLLIDTLRASKLRLYEPSSRVQTPALDRFAAEATLFERAQSPENWTKPAVASILTSLHPSTHETRYDASSLPMKALMLGEVLQSAHFKTASFIANGYVSTKFGFGRGWDHYTNYIRESRNTNASNVYREAFDWIEEHRDERFFVYIQTIDPHVPYDPPDEYLKMYDDRAYDGPVKNRRTHLLLEDAKKSPPKVVFTESDKIRLKALHDGEISYHDHHMGLFLRKLEKLGLRENTLFVITADHGEELDDHGSWGHGHSVYQELLHVPLLFRWPGAIEGGKRVHPAVTTLDIAPTVLEALDVPIPDAFEGRSLLGHMRGAKPTGPYVAFSDFQENRRVIRAGQWKLIVRGNLTYTLFDLERDPHERNPLTGNEHPIVLRYLRILLGQYLGANDRRSWVYGDEEKNAQQGPTPSEGNRLRGERAELDEKTCRELASLGYVVAECKTLLDESM